MTIFKAKNIVFLEPYYGGSHKYFLDSLVKYSSHNIQTLKMPPRHWKWRSFGSSFYFLEELKKLDLNKINLIICTEMVDISILKSQLDIPIIQYVHENQFEYPLSPNENPNERAPYLFKMFQNLMVADWSYFNSDFNLNSSLNGCSSLLQKFPDYNKFEFSKTQSVLSLGIELDKFKQKFKKNDTPTIIWNHRWDHDKNPSDFFNILNNLTFDFKLIIAGAGKGNALDLFNVQREIFKEKIIHFGKAESFEEYRKLIHMSDLSIVTSNQDFFGISALELISGGVMTYLPNRLAFPEHIPHYLHKDFLYNDQADLLAKISKYDDNSLDKLQDYILKYEWNNIIEKYDSEFLKHSKDL